MILAILLKNIFVNKASPLSKNGSKFLLSIVLYRNIQIINEENINLTLRWVDLCLTKRCSEAGRTRAGREVRAQGPT